MKRYLLQNVSTLHKNDYLLTDTEQTGHFRINEKEIKEKRYFLYMLLAELHNYCALYPSQKSVV